MEHSNATPNGVIGLGGKQREGRCAFADENRDAVPHSVIHFFETKNVDVPLRRFVHVTHAQSDVIDTLKFHRLYTIKASKSADLQIVSRYPSPAASRRPLPV